MATRALPLTPAPQGFSARSLPAVDWRRVARLFHASRALDEIEESRLVPEK
jgi:2-oxoisovalerate dehydrogenase E1 component